MKRRTLLTAIMLAASALPFAVQADPGNGKGNGRGNGKGNGAGGRGRGASHGHQPPGQSGKGNRDYQSWSDSGSRGRGDRDYDDYGRYLGYFDDHRDRRGRVRGDSYADLIFAGITAALARSYVRDIGGFGSYTSLPPGIRKNLARGKPLPPGLAKKMVPGSLLRRLPRYSGYEWYISGTDLLLVSIAGAVVADVLYDVFD